MPYETFWHLNPKTLKAYYKAYERKMEDRNSELWLLGAYTYQAILSASPIFNPFAKKGTKPIPYLEKPFEQNRKQQVTSSVPSSVIRENERLKTYAYLNSWARSNNEKNNG